MKRIAFIIVATMLIGLPLVSIAQNERESPDGGGGEYLVEKNDAAHPCITNEQYRAIEQKLAANVKLLNVDQGSNKTTTTTFAWPLTTANGANDCSYYYLGNYVDQDTTSSIKDYNCGTTTYNGHRGDDITIAPYPFYKMDNNMVQVIAAAPGTIIQKQDGQFDKNCAMNSDTANYIIVQHADGSVALYWHLKKGSLTSKTVGQTVATGDYLGIVGSSGSSSGPHLHFEVWTGITANTLNEAYSGTCNTLNASSWWAAQKPYTEPAILRASTHLVAPILPTCPTTETPNEDTCFNPGVTGKLYIFIRNETMGLTANLSILNPDGSAFTSWIHNSTTSYPASYWFWNKVLPTTPGLYTFKVVYNGTTCARTFRIDCTTASGIANAGEITGLIVYPNPAKDVLTINNLSQTIDYKLYNIVGTEMGRGQAEPNRNKINIHEIPNGMYVLELLSPGGEMSIVRFMKE